MLRTTLTILTLALLVGCSETTTESVVDKTQVIGSEPAPQVAFNTEGLPTVSFAVPSMHCEVMCVPKVRKTLERQPGVVDVSVDLDTKTATVAVKSGVFDADKAIKDLKTAEFSDATLKADAS